MRRFIVLFAIAFSLAGATAGWRLYQMSRLSTVMLTQGEIVSSVFASGKTKAEKEANLAFKSTGRITFLPVKKNQVVAKGQAVATIDTSDLNANLEKDLQDYLKTRWDFEETTKETYKNSITTDTIKRVKEKAQFDLNKSVTDVEIADRALKNASLYTPFAGVVTSVNGEINEWVSSFSTEPLVTITDPQTVYFEAEVEEEDMGKITLGQEASVLLDAYPETRFAGRVAEIDQKAVVKTNGDTVIPVKIILSAEQNLPLVGLNGDAQMILETKKNVLTLPKRAIHQNKGQTTVVVRQDFRLKHVVVETGVTDTKLIEIKSGIGEGQYVVLPSELD